MESKRHELINQKEVAARACVTIKTIQRWRVSGKDGFPKPITQRPGSILWLAQSVDEWITKTRVDKSGQ
jgi:predicted DNA-binding transcriptional regulator AlpA